MIVETTSGKVEGIHKDGVVQFRGIPFAQAERFKAPARAAAWEGVRLCDSFGPIAPQGVGALEQMLGSRPSESSEPDCLSLNVYTTGESDSPRPVMFWIHGGAFVAGTGSTPWYSGSRLAADRGVVVVTINYRLGIFGYLHLDGILDDPAFRGSGNNGVRDQIAGLEWVRDNIDPFGGDPGNVTIFGESAGGMSVGTLLAAPSAAGLFHRAIAQSGAASNAATAASAEATAGRLLDYLGVAAGEGERLLELPVTDLLSAQERAVQDRANGALALPFVPVVDGVVFEEPPLDSIAAGSSANVPVLIGTTADEFNLFAFLDRMQGGIDDSRLLKRVNRLFGEGAAEAIELYRSARPGATAQDVWCAIATDWVFRIPAVRLAEAQLDTGGAVWTYLFSYRSKAFNGELGACHAIEIPFAFDNVHRRGVDVLLGEIGDGTRSLAKSMSAAWAAFAHSGVPGDDSLPDWPRYDLEARPVMNLDTTSELIHDPGAAERLFWGSIA